jgi:Ca2+-binding EF-hand superfamily protein
VSLVDQGLIDRAEAVFASMDANSSGTIDIAELKSFLAKSGIPESKAKQQASTWFNTLDENNDGKVYITELRLT